MQRKQLCANNNWRFYRGNPPSKRPDAVLRSKAFAPWDRDYDDTAWEVVSLPHTVRNEALMCSGGLNFQGICWYRRHFIIPNDFAGLEKYFELEAAMQRVDAWLDGEPLGCRTGGFLPMAFDMTGLSVGDEHVLVLKVDNSDMLDVPPGKPQGALDFCYFGGLYRDAWLHVMNKIHFTDAVHAGKVASGGLFIRYPDVSKDKAVVAVDAHFVNRNANTINVFIRLLLDGEVVYEGSEKEMRANGEGTEKAMFTVEQPRLWHPYHPNLYRLTAQLFHGTVLIDEISERIGIRTTAFTTEGFFINGERLFLNGANRHQEYAHVGFAIPDALQKRDVRLLRDAGIISIRLGHYPQDSAFMNACDELGVLCVIPTPGWQIHPSSVMFDENSYENTRRLIRMNRNHPSALLWEPILNETDYPEYFAKKQLEIVQEEMGDAPAWCACDMHYAYSKHYPVNYHGMEIDKPHYTREYGDNYVEQFGPMNTLRRVRRGEHVSFYQGGEKAMIRSAQEHFEAYLSLRLDTTTSGGAMWAGIDHNRGYETNEAAVGILDLLRLPKYYYYLHMAQQTIEEAGVQCFIANDWTENSPRDVTVYTNAPVVRLLLNDRIIGTLSVHDAWKSASDGIKEKLKNLNPPTMVHPPIVFRDVPWEAGVLKAETIIDGAVNTSCEVRTPGEPFALKMAPQWAGVEKWVADSADLLMVHAYVVDANGTVVKNVEPMIYFAVEGDAQLVGDGEAWTRANPAQAEAGIAGALLRAGRKAGKVILHASANGLMSADLYLETIADTHAALPGPTCIPPPVKPLYTEDSKETFSVRQSLKLSSFYSWDMAANKPATASSAAPGREATFANKGRIGSTSWMAADTVLPQWWQCDMLEPCMVYGVSIAWLDDGVWYDYEIQTSLDGISWKNQYDGHSSGQSRLPNRFAASVKAQYLRIVVHSLTGGKPVGIYLVEVHGNTNKKKD